MESFGPKNSDSQESADERRITFARRALIQAGWAAPVVGWFSLPQLVGAASVHSDAGPPHGDTTPLHGDGAPSPHLDASHIDSGTPAPHQDTGHVDVFPHIDSGIGGTHIDSTESHTDLAHVDSSGTHTDLGFHFDQAPQHNDTPPPHADN